MKEIAKLFFKLGCVGFGGPIATMAMMEQEAVQKRQWLSLDRFNQAYALIKVLPGASSTQMAIYLGQVRGGRLGGFIAGGVFIFPAYALIVVLSYFYAKLHSVPSASALFSGMQVAALIVIAESVSRMAKPYSKSTKSIVLTLVTGIMIFLNPRLEPLLVLGIGVIGAFGPGLFAAFLNPGSFLLAQNTVSPDPSASVVPVAQAGNEIAMSPAVAASGAAAGGIAGLWSTPLMKLVIICIKTGFLVFGTGLAVVPVLEADIVTKYHWLTHAEFLDGLAIGQVTPGPVLTTTTFIGYKVAGFLGATAATAAIFAPGFFNILVLIPAFEKRVQGSPRLKGFTNGAIPVVIGGIVATTLRLGIMTVDSWLLVALLAVTGLVVFRWKPPVWIVIPACGLLNFVLNSLIRH